ncbi:hypothetical protein AYO20_04520 [Fonsecaea nubica]|uniref:Uncharacterized protein n=1 Tax=Fonsecaea nubica TaxID=856822 RepID=A0A178D2Z5_9EURO|nr:hypothetical protein AYO20_04520 [Fonsecaea nubica]OAL36106.1 hypothetical protein AYO20_04520 [Fonsecaea nubica]
MRCSTVFAGLLMAASTMALPLEASSNTALQPVEAAKDIAARAPAPQLDLTNLLGDVGTTVTNLLTNLGLVLDPVLDALTNVTAAVEQLVIETQQTTDTGAAVGSTVYTLTLTNALNTLLGLVDSISGLGTTTVVTTDDVTLVNSLSTALGQLFDTVQTLLSADSTNGTLISLSDLLTQLIADVNTVLENIST